MALGEQARGYFPEEGMLELKQESNLDSFGWGLGVEETVSSGEATPWARAAAGKHVVCAVRVTA